MLKKIIQLVNILDRKDEFKLIVLFFMMIIAVLLEVISIASILPLTKEFFSSGENLLFLKEIEFELEKWKKNNPYRGGIMNARLRDQKIKKFRNKLENHFLKHGRFPDQELD